jgi:hypothetical protein
VDAESATVRRKIMRKGLWMSFGLVLLLITSSWAQVDPAKVLVGTWEGELALQGRGNRGRTLIIDSVTQNDGKWVAQGRYGITGQGLGRVPIEVDVSGDRVWIRFKSGANSDIRLNLLQEKYLVGTLTIAGTSQGSNDRSMKLERR